jgi:hypothetical protein
MVNHLSLARAEQMETLSRAQPRSHPDAGWECRHTCVLNAGLLIFSAAWGPFLAQELVSFACACTADTHTYLRKETSTIDFHLDKAVVSVTLFDKGIEASK